MAWNKCNTNTNLNIWVEKSETIKIEKPEYLLQFDHIIMKDGTVYLVNKIENDEIELMPTGKIIIKRDELLNFMNGSKYIERKECFEKK